MREHLVIIIIYDGLWTLVVVLMELVQKCVILKTLPHLSTDLPKF